jgi:hypothetical protein
LIGRKWRRLQIQIPHKIMECLGGEYEEADGDIGKGEPPLADKAVEQPLANAHQAFAIPSNAVGLDPQLG